MERVVPHPTREHADGLGSFLRPEISDLDGAKLTHSRPSLVQPVKPSCGGPDRYRVRGVFYSFSAR